MLGLVGGASLVVALWRSGQHTRGAYATMAGGWLSDVVVALVVFLCALPALVVGFRRWRDKESLLAWGAVALVALGPVLAVAITGWRF